jgi:proteic killer suppression protein
MLRGDRIQGFAQGSPGRSRIEALKGDRRGQWSIRVNDQWRVCFRFVDGRALDVEIVDHH